MVGVVTRFGHGVDEAGRSSPVCRGIGRDNNLEFLDRVLSESVGHSLTAAGASEIIAGGIGPVEGVQVGAVSIGIASVLAALFTAEADQSGLSIWAGIGS